MMIKSALKLSVVSKNIFSLSRYIIGTHYNNQQHNDIIIKPEKEESNEKTISNLKLDIDFKLLTSNNRIDYKYTISVLKSFQNLYKDNGIPLSELKENKDFLKIIFIVNKYLRYLEMKQAIAFLNVLNTIQVPASSLIINSIMQLIRLSINELSLQEIYFLTSVLKYMEETPLSRAISIGIVEVFKAQVKFQIDTDNIEELVQAFIYASKYINDRQLLTFLINTINNNKRSIDLNSAVVILLRLIKLQTVEDVSFYSLLNRVATVVMKKSVLLNESTVIAILAKLNSSILKGNCRIYNPILIDKLVDTSISRNYGLYQWLKILDILNNIRHINVPLLEHLLNYLCEYPSVFAKFYPTYCTQIVSGLALANYKPQLWNELQKNFINCTKYLDSTSLYSFAIDLAALNYYDQNILQEIFTNSKITNILDEKKNRLFCRLYDSVKILFPTYSGPWPSNETIQLLNDWKSKQNQLFYPKELNFPLLSILEELVGGSVYVNTNIKIYEIEEPIDHLIFLQYEYPVNVKSVISLNNNNTANFLLDIKDFKTFSNIDKLAIIFFKSEDYSRNMLTLKSFDLLRIKILEKMSYKVIPIFDDVWQTMSHNNQLSYLKDLLRIKKLN